MVYVPKYIVKIDIQDWDILCKTITEAARKTKPDDPNFKKLSRIVGQLGKAAQAQLCLIKHEHKL